MKNVSLFEQEKILEQGRRGESAVMISRNLGIRKHLVEKILNLDIPPPPLSYINLKIDTVEDLKTLIVSVINGLQDKRVDPKTANSIFYGAGLLKDIFKGEETKELTQRIGNLEDVVLCRKKT